MSIERLVYHLNVRINSTSQIKQNKQIDEILAIKYEFRLPSLYVLADGRKARLVGEMLDVVSTLVHDAIGTPRMVFQGGRSGKLRA